MAATEKIGRERRDGESIPPKSPLKEGSDDAKATAAYRCYYVLVLWVGG